MAVRFEYISRTDVRVSILTIYGQMTGGSRFPSFGGLRQVGNLPHLDWTEDCGKSCMTLQLTKDEQNTVTHALNHAYRQSELIHRIEERDCYFSAGQLDEIQGALAQEAMVNDGILRGAHNREALAAGINAHALLQRLQCMGLTTRDWAADCILTGRSIETCLY